MPDRRFGISTHLFHDHRLTREHLVHIAAHGFDAVEVFATRSHFDYTDDAAVDELAEWLSDTRLALHSMHAPAFEAFRHGQWVGAFSNAAADETRRRAAVAEADAALRVAERVPFRYLVVHVGVPTATSAAAIGDNQASTRGGRLQPARGVIGDNQLGPACRSIEEIAGHAARRGVQVALEVIPNPLSSAQALADLIEGPLEGLDVGLCLDYGHAHLMGDLGDAIEATSGHLWTTHVHDNGGRRDDHLVPYAGRIEWEMAMMATQKIGYDGLLMFEVGDTTGDPVEVLQRTANARDRLQQAFITF